MDFFIFIVIGIVVGYFLKTISSHRDSLQEVVSQSMKIELDNWLVATCGDEPSFLKMSNKLKIEEKLIDILTDKALTVLYYKLEKEYKQRLKKDSVTADMV